MAQKKKSSKKAPKAKKSTKKPVAVKKSPRQQPLPGMEDRAITELDKAALDYADIRDQRVALTGQETEAKQVLLGLMHAKKKTHYQHGNILIDIVPEGEKLKVKIKKAEDMTEEELQEGNDEQPDEGEIEAAEEVEEDDAEVDSEEATAS